MERRQPSRPVPPGGGFWWGSCPTCWGSSRPFDIVVALLKRLGNHVPDLSIEMPVLRRGVQPLRREHCVRKVLMHSFESSDSTSLADSITHLRDVKFPSAEPACP